MGRLATGHDARTLGAAALAWLVFSGVVVLFVLAGRGCG
jgi:hypothetical protein